MSRTINGSNFLESEFRPPPLSQALFEIHPVPLEKTVSYGTGTGKGPVAILAASNQLEAYDGVSCPGSAGIFTAPPIDCHGPIDEVLKRIETVALEGFAAERIPVFLGGEHSLSLAPVRALARLDKDFGVVQFDAHADLRDEYQGSRYSHACVMRRIAEENIPVFQFAVRSLCPEEVEFRKSASISFLDAAEYHQHGMRQQLLPEEFPRDIYLTFDVDALDVSLMPATGTPEPGGLFWHQAITVMQRLDSEGCRIIGLDVVELAPMTGLHAYDYTAAKLVYTLMGFAARRRTDIMPGSPP